MKTTSTKSNRTVSLVRSFIWLEQESFLFAIEHGKCMDRFKTAGLIQMKRASVGGGYREGDPLEPSSAKLLESTRDQAPADTAALLSRMHGNLADVSDSARDARKVPIMEPVGRTAMRDTVDRKSPHQMLSVSIVSNSAQPCSVRYWLLIRLSQVL